MPDLLLLYLQLLLTISIRVWIVGVALFFRRINARADVQASSRRHLEDIGPIGRVFLDVAPGTADMDADRLATDVHSIPGLDVLLVRPHVIAQKFP